LSKHSPLPGLGAANVGPEILGAVEVHMEQIVGMAIGNDGRLVGLRGVDRDGHVVVFTFPTSIGEVCASQLQKATEGARRVLDIAQAPLEPTLAVEQPQTFQVFEKGELVLIAFDPGTPGQGIKGFPAGGAMALARAIAESATKVFARQPKRLILPHHLTKEN
jgi:hypothetical protein